MPVLPEKHSSILLVDSDPDSASTLSALISSWNYHVEVLADGAAAFRRLNGANPPAMAIVNYELPSMKGFEVIAETRRRSRRQATWLMLMSAAADLEKIEMAHKAGVDDFLLKPVNETDLLIRLRTAERVQHLYHELQEQTQAVRFHSAHDSLTGLLNRESTMRLLFQETDRAQRTRTSLTLMLIDLDKFSEINIEFGYETGDVVLREFAQRLRRYLRSYDILGRYGEDEFLIGLPGCATHQATAMAERLQNTVLAKSYHVHRDVLSATASIGLSTSQGRSPLIILREAECALRNAKLAGRNCVRAFAQPTEPMLEIAELKLSDTVPPF
ncbi:diguanylate cyclase [Alloacidobacterium sp.]|uniref:GGDEF domain-containing response regulator n=1 Tax=Alloacidobacterium sp. TaxID=2951999 RepID=UPI002D2A5BB8|nr:diguanylate cyclase [Alloacidobacterium sp.]HYK34656.1 diguanylate cyclase [Alloacidobacterium sp.]